MISNRLTTRFPALIAALALVAACGEGPAADDATNAVIDPPAQCNPGRPDCSIASDFPDSGDLNSENSAGVRYSSYAASLVIDRVTVLPDSDGDGVPDDADDCPATPDWITCDNDPSNDGLYQTLFYDPARPDEIVRTSLATATADIPRIDVYFLVDATPTLSEEIAVLQAGIGTIIEDIRAEFSDAQFGVGLYREYPLFPLARRYSQAPFHHVLDLTDDETLVETAVSTLNVVDNNTAASAATQALYSVASGRGLGRFVPNRSPCPSATGADIGYPCFREDALHVVMNITDSPTYNGPVPAVDDGSEYADPPFDPNPPPDEDPVGMAVELPPVQMFPELFAANDVATALDLGDLSRTSLTLMGMSTLLTDEVNTSVLAGCASPPPGDDDDDDDGPPGADMDGKDVVLKLRFDNLEPPPVLEFTASAANTHWSGANVALFDNALLTSRLACDNGATESHSWGSIEWPPTTEEQYYLVVDGLIPAADPGHMPEGAFSVSILHDGDPAKPAWLTSEAPAVWDDVEAALLASHVRVSSVITLRDAASMVDATRDARLTAAATNALTKVGGEWVTELATGTGEGLDAAVSNTVNLAKTDSVYDFSIYSESGDDGGIDERVFVDALSHSSCAEGEVRECENGSDNSCVRCDLGAALEYEALFANTSVEPTDASQVFDFQLLVRADDALNVEQIPVRVMVPDSDSHRFDDTPEASFYLNTYDTTARCNQLEAPKWGLFTWEGDTPPGTSIEFQFRTANTTAELATVDAVFVKIPADTTSHSFDLTRTLIDNDQVSGLPYLQITAVLNPSVSPPATPELDGWSFEFFCEAAQ